MHRLVAAFLLTAAVFVGLQVESDAIVTTDPNTLGARANTAAPKPDADKRLAQKVSYESGYVRLHRVADDLAKLTGVSITAGSSAKDWHVRDIPLVVCVKDLRLGKVLSTVAEATHTLLSSKTLDNGQKAYRFYRNKRLQDDIDGKLDSALQHKYELIDWTWDAMLKLADSPDAQKELAKSCGPDNTVVALAKMLRFIGPSAREKVMAGKSINVDLRNAECAPLVDAIHSGCEAFINRIRNESHSKLDPADLEKPEQIAAAGLSIKLNEGGGAGLTDVILCIPKITCGDWSDPYMCDLSWQAPALETLHTLNLPQMPKPDVADQRSDRPSDPRLLALEADADWSQSPFGDKVKLTLPDNRLSTFAEALTALAKVSGMNIVSEDFLSYRWGNEDEYKPFFGTETVASSILKNAHGSWFYDSEQKLLIGWAWGKGAWRSSHRSLVPESLLLSLSEKQDTSGTDLDDTTPILELTQAQRNDWISDNRDTLWLGRAFPQDRPLWRLYNSLSSENKTAARSAEGLPVAALGVPQVGSFLKQKIEEEQAKSLMHKDDAELQAILDPSVLRTATMRIKITSPTFPSPGGKQWNPMLHHTYTMEIEYEKDGKKTTYRTSDIKVSFPVYSDKRELELGREAVNRHSSVLPHVRIVPKTLSLPHVKPYPKVCRCLSLGQCIIELLYKLIDAAQEVCWVELAECVAK